MQKIITVRYDAQCWIIPNELSPTVKDIKDWLSDKNDDDIVVGVNKNTKYSPEMYYISVDQLVALRITHADHYEPVKKEPTLKELNEITMNMI